MPSSTPLPSVSYSCSRYTGIAALILLFVLLTGTLPAVEANGPTGRCVALGDGGAKVSIPLSATFVALDIKPGLLEAEVDQAFTNTTSTALEATYTYPLPEGATITAFELRYQDKVLQSQVRARREAKMIYEEAKNDGRKAAMMEQQDPSLFSTAIANFMPGETVHVVLRFLQPLELTSEGVDVRFPMVAGGKYQMSDTAETERSEEKPTPSNTPQTVSSPAPVFGFDVQIAGYPVKSIRSASHAIRVEDLGGNLHGVSLKDEVAVPDRDFLLHIETETLDQSEPSFVSQDTATGHYGMITVFPPARKKNSSTITPPRDILFLVDRSGSMSGTRLESAKQGLKKCLNLLRPEDRFQIAIFDSNFSFLENEWTPGTLQNLRAAASAVEGIHTEGGTELQKALGPCLERFEQGNRQQLLILLTDGDVGEAGSMYNLLEKRIGNTRLFVFGIGSAPNATLLKKMAELGRGQARYIANDNEVDSTLAEFFATLDTPVLKDLQLQLLDAQKQVIDADFFPAKIGDVFLGRPMQSTFRITGQKPAFLLYSGSEDGREVKACAPLTGLPLRGSGLEKQFGRLWHQELLEETWRTDTDEKKEVIKQKRLEIALLFQLVTDLTSRVVAAPQKSRSASDPLKSTNVAGGIPADQGGGDEDLIELTPFMVETDDPYGTYTASGSLAGTRVRTQLCDVGSAISVVTGNFIADFAPSRAEDVRDYLTDLDERTLNAGPGKLTGLINGLPFSTAVDPRTLSLVKDQYIGPDTSNFAQYDPTTRSYTRVGAGTGTQGTTNANLQFNRVLGGKGGLPLLGILSWSKLNEPQLSAYLASRKRFDGGYYGGRIQWRHLDTYGTMGLIESYLMKTLTNDLQFEVKAGWNHLKRNDPSQFALGGEHFLCDNLGYAHLDLLTAEIESIDEGFLSTQFTGSKRVGPVELSGYAGGSFHTQHGVWSGQPSAAVEVNQLTSSFSAGAALGSRELPFHLGLDFTQSSITADDVSEGSGSVGKASVNLTVADESPLQGYVVVVRGTSRPWIPTGISKLVSNQWIPRAPAVESNEGARAGVRLNLFDSRLTLDTSVFREKLENLAYRDWAWERDHQGNAFTLQSDGSRRAGLSCSTFEQAEREGWSAQFAFSPIRSLSVIANSSTDWNDNGPVRGGNRRANAYMSYEWTSGILSHLTLGGGASYRNDQIYNDGYVLSGGTRVDLFASYRFSLSPKHKISVRLNLQNLGDFKRQPTRFAPPRGRELLLSVSEEF